MKIDAYGYIFFYIFALSVSTLHDNILFCQTLIA